jgi:hypothetical protein
MATTNLKAEVDQVSTTSGVSNTLQATETGLTNGIVSPPPE